MLRFSKVQPTELRVSDLPFPQPFSDSDRIANALWLLENNPTGRALLPAEYRDDAGPRFAAIVPAANDHAIADGIAARLAEETASRQSGGIQPQVGPVLLAQNTGGGSGQQDPKFYNFFDRHYEPVAKVAAQIGVDPALILGLSAHESNWGTSGFATKLNNPLGYTPDGKKPMAFPSVDDAWNRWVQTHGPRVQGAGGDAEAFVDRLLLDNRYVYGPTVGSDRLGAYNSQQPPVGDPDWRDKALGAIHSVRRRLLQWQAARGTLPQREE